METKQYVILLHKKCDRQIDKIMETTIKVKRVLLTVVNLCSTEFSIQFGHSLYGHLLVLGTNCLKPADDRTIQEIPGEMEGRTCGPSMLHSSLSWLKDILEPDHVRSKTAYLNSIPTLMGSQCSLDRIMQ